MKISMMARAATCVVCGVLACSRGTQTAKLPSGPSQQRAAAEAKAEALEAGKADRETTVQLSEEIRKECRFPENPSELPKFELDQATLRGPDQNVLADLASCLTDGPLQNRTITIVGRTDPRGTDSHNQQLGADRANAARNYLISRGVPEQKLLVTSRGEEGANGTSEEAWAVERRVDLVLGDRTERTSINQTPAANSRNANASPGSPYADQSEGSRASGKVTGSSGPGTDSVPGK